MKILLYALVCICVATLHASFAEAKNVALVIGNSLYTESISKLENPANDARDIANTFAEQGYDVVVAFDLGQRELQSKLIDFRTKADAAEIAIVYYAGHGIEIEGQNYLVPVDARLSDQRSAALELININTVLDQISGASSLRMLVLDACRNNPFVSKMKQQGNGRSVGRGLGRVTETQSETLIAFAAAAGAVTPDGEPGGNSPFTAAFLKAMQGPAVDVRILLGKVRDEMREIQLGSQPATYGSLGGSRIVINPLHEAKFSEEGTADTPPPDQKGDLMADFLKADALNTLAGWDTFINTYDFLPGNEIYQLALRKRETLLRERAAQAEEAAQEREKAQAELEALRQEAARAKEIERERAETEAQLAKLREQAALAAAASKEKAEAEARLAALRKKAAEAEEIERQRAAVEAALKEQAARIEEAAREKAKAEEELAVLREQAAQAALILKEKEAAEARLAALTEAEENSRMASVSDPLVQTDPQPGSELAALPLVDEEQTLIAPEPEDEFTAAEARDKAIRDLQILLKDRNCYRGAIDGLFGRGTTGGATRLAATVGIKDRVNSKSSTEEYEAVLAKFGESPGTNCPAIVVKKSKPIVKKKTTVRVKKAAPKPAATAPKVAVAEPKPAAKSKSSSFSDFQDSQGSHCDWSNRGNVCE